MKQEKQALPCRSAIHTGTCILVMFGGSGDLTSRKRIPALFRLYRKGFLPQSLVMLGCARSQFSDEEYRRKLGAVCQPCHEDMWADFSKRLFYEPFDYHDSGSYERLKERLQVLDELWQTQGNVLFDLAVPPQLYPVIAEQLGSVGLTKSLQGKGWVRMVVEKPFGRHYQSAMELDALLCKYFTEQQIFRIDHYLAKETVQNILSLRFANHIFEPLWNRNHIDWIGILSAEELGE